MSLSPLPYPEHIRSRPPPSGRARSSITRPDQPAPSHLPVNVRSSERLVSALAGGFAIAWGLSRPGPGAKVAAALGSGLVFRGVSGHCHVYEALGIDRAPQVSALTGRARAPHHVDVLRTVTVLRSADAVFRAWRQPETFARAMRHFASHTSLGSGRTRWTLVDPIGREHSWVTEIVAEEPGKTLRWQTEASAPLLKNLTLELRPAPGNRGTEMTLHLRIEPPAGALGRALMKLVGKAPALVVERALGNVKSLLEAGEVPSLENNPSARTSAEL